VEEVNMFKDDGNVLHFSAPKGESSFVVVAFLMSEATRHDLRSQRGVVVGEGGEKVGGCAGWANAVQYRNMDRR
jgi:hypothetical protein